MHHARAGNAHIDDALRLTDTMECTGHKGVILHRIGENNQLSAAQTILVSGNFRRFLDNPAHFCHSIHIDAGLGRTHIHRGADTVGSGQGLGDGTDQLPIAFRAALLHQGRKTADEVDTALFCRFIQGLGDGHIGVCFASSGHQGNGRDGDPLIDDGNTKFPLNIAAHLD